jgi:hypothetical protein
MLERENKHKMRFCLSNLVHTKGENEIRIERGRRRDRGREGERGGHKWRKR